MPTYRGQHIAIFLVIAVASTMLVNIGLPFTIEPLLDDPSKFHAFLYERSLIQWLTVGVLLFVFPILVDRIIRAARLSAAVREHGAAARRRTDELAQAVGMRVEAVQRCKLVHGQEAAAAYCAELRADDESDLDRVYGLVANAMQLMLALGFLGTVWGVSQSVFGSFANLGNATTSELKQSLQGFTAGLATALDTTVLGILCSLAATIFSSVTNWMDVGAVQGLDAMVRRHVWIDRSSALADRGVQGLEAQLEALPGVVATATVEALRAEREPRGFGH